MRNINISNFRKDIFTYVNEAIEYNEPINVSAKNGNIVVINEEEYNGMIETLHLLGVPKMRKILLEGMEVSREELVEIDWVKELES